ncbi:MAG: 16S rRNA (cytidine(1402)-2'-O)-methyltransferase [Ahrensia sp.]|nr:16S rRNA (cytidine(1402)-2'-O)-methyltransferase [Ahrensia sp.]
MKRNSYIIGGHEISVQPLEPALYLVSTPIGNLGDMTIRGLETLAACDVLACEDTRVTRRLLDRYAIAQKPYAYHEHNAKTVGPKLIEQLSFGKSVALVSDAGTPLVSDPGYRLGLEARQAGFRVIPIPGASAVLAGLAASGLPADDFRFVGFLPNKDGARRNFLEGLAHAPSTLIFFEAPTRLAATLRAISDVMGQDRLVCVGRELTKHFETILTMNASEMTDHFANETIKGEIVILVAPAPVTQEAASEADIDAMLKSLLKEMPASKAAKEAARMTGLQKSELYARLVTMKDADG